MILNYSIKSEDLIAFYKKDMKDNSFLFKNYTLIIVIILSLIFCYNHPPTQDNIPFYSTSSIIFSIILNVSTGVGMVFLLRYAYVERMLFTISINPSLLGKRELELNENFLELKSDNMNSEIQLSSIKKISSYKNHYFIYIDKQIAVILPKSTPGADDFINKLSFKVNKNVC